MDEALARKQRSLAILKKNNIPCGEDLPVIASRAEARIRSGRHLAERAVCCLLSVQYAIDLLNDDEVEESAEFFHGLLESWGLSNKLTKTEQALFAGQLDPEILEAFPWRYEAFWVLFWALGCADELSLPRDCRNGDEAQIVSQYDGFEDFLAEVRPRPADDILDQADLTYRLDQACLEADLAGREAPAGLNPDVVMERLMAFNWLIGSDDDWDNA